jgi:hypothetical protein
MSNRIPVLHILREHFADRKVVLNPLSHANTTTVTRAEIQGAIDAVDALNFR